MLSPRPPPRPHGLNESHVIVALVALILAFLWLLVAGNPELPLAELTGKLLHRLAIYLAAVGLILFGFGGWKYQLVEKLKENTVALAIVAAAIILGASNVLGH